MKRYSIKNERETQIMKDNGRYHAEFLAKMKEFIKEGQTTLDIEFEAQKVMKKLELKPAQIGYRGYPAATCIGVNDDGLHCIPQSSKVIKEGDIVGFDAVTLRRGFHMDGGFTIGIGKVDKEAENLVNTNIKALNISIENCFPGNKVGNIGAKVQDVIESAGYNVLEGFVGHGIGVTMHEDPQIPNYGERGQGMKLRVGMTLALDTMVAEGSGDLYMLSDGWSTKMSDGGRLSFYEHTVLVTKDGPEILTKL